MERRYSVSEIDELRDLTKRLMQMRGHEWGLSWHKNGDEPWVPYERHLWVSVKATDVELRLRTYLAQNVTVADLQAEVDKRTDETADRPASEELIKAMGARPPRGS